MYPFPQSVDPAVRLHFDAQKAFMNELSQSMLRSFQQIYQLNMQLGQSLLEEVTGTAQRMLGGGRPTDALSAAAAAPLPGTDKLRAYQQQLSQLVAAAQVDLSRVTEQQAQETSRTARALAEDVTRATAEETEKEARDAFRKEAERGARFQGNLQRSATGAGAQPDGQAGSSGFPGNVQGSINQTGLGYLFSPRWP